MGEPFGALAWGRGGKVKILSRARGWREKGGERRKERDNAAQGPTVPADYLEKCMITRTLGLHLVALGAPDGRATAASTAASTAAPTAEPPTRTTSP